MEIPGGRKTVTAVIGALAIGSGGLLLEYGYRQGEFSREDIPRTRTDVDDAMDEVMTRVAQLENWEVGTENRTGDYYFGVSCGSNADSGPKLLEYSDRAQRISMVCPTKFGPGRVLEYGAWVEGDGRLQDMSWQIGGERGEGAQSAVLTASEGDFELVANPTGFDGKGGKVKCKSSGDDDGGLSCSFSLGRGAEKSVTLEGSAGRRMLKWVRAMIKGRLTNMRNMLDLVKTN